MKKADIIAELKKNNISFDPKKSVQELKKLLPKASGEVKAEERKKVEPIKTKIFPKGVINLGGESDHITSALDGEMAAH